MKMYFAGIRDHELKRMPRWPKRMLLSYGSIHPSGYQEHKRLCPAVCESRAKAKATR